ncbi:GAF domain-containing protein [Herbidospora galbida]|uniref:GAF domain-containing protein n=1 Tax=Herbidospora galbida TaxID=2575442 RepID=A0A4U3M916_9ACTN|nr:GAF domain-containing protein [Herbidospora galbida]TKK85391.1 GAF domain-containing protein [Herbidospora galbida]
MARESIPGMGPDELLSELRTQRDAALASRDRVRALVEAVILLDRDLHPETVLRRTVKIATELVDAAHGALRFPEERRSPLEYVPAGRGEEERRPPGPDPLERLVRDPRPLRPTRIPGHPAFLGVPLRVGGEVFGVLCLTGKRDGADFDEDDEDVIVTLATAAGAAVENAHLYETAHSREARLQAESDLTTSLLSGAGPGDVLAQLTRRMREIADSDTALVFFPVDDGTRLRALISEGAGGLTGGEVGSDTSLPGLALRTGDAVMVDDLIGEGYETIRNVPIGPAAAVPLTSAKSTHGVLVLGKWSGRIPFSPCALRMLRSCAGQAAGALELAKARLDAERLRTLEDRDRIARDLHDVVIQRLFAVAMTLMSTVRLVDHPEAECRVRHSVNELDATIRQIRATIFALQGPQGADESGLRARVAELVADTYGDLGFRPRLRLDGQLDYGVPEEVAEQVLAVLHEALSNVARHAGARNVGVTLEQDGGQVTLVVEDDGVGLPPGGRRSGLRNLQKRADDLGGFFEAGPRAGGGGTRLVWRVPVS